MQAKASSEQASRPNKVSNTKQRKYVRKQKASKKKKQPSKHDRQHAAHLNAIVVLGGKLLLFITAPSSAQYECLEHERATKQQDLTRCVHSKTYLGGW